jgi:hypothetical protein
MLYVYSGESWLLFMAVIEIYVIPFRFRIDEIPFTEGPVEGREGTERRTNVRQQLDT